MHIQRATASDVAAITAYNVALAEESEHLTLEPEVVRRGVEAVFQDASRGVYFGAYEANQIIGVLLVTYEWSDWRNGNFWWLQSVYVHPQHRARGVFKTLLTHVVNEAEKDPTVCGFRLYVDADNQRARDVYAKMRFERTNYQVLVRTSASRQAGGS
jgi:GNAT superfamily N-acetyltransferase